MKFKNQGHPLNDEGMDQICSALGVSEPEVWAVLTVETHGFGFFKDRRPQILFERHIFHRLTNGKHDTGYEDISNARLWRLCWRRWRISPLGEGDEA